MTNMSYYALKERSYDDHIIGAFGGEDKCASTLGDVIRLIEKQPNGEKGVLITNGSVEANVFFIYDVLGELRPVGVYRHEGAWRFCSSSGSNPCCLFDYKRIFAPSSAPVPGKEPKKSLLQPVGTVILPATTESFHSLEWFNMNNSEVKIANVGSSFKKFFGDMEVSPREGVELSIRDLARDANDTEIIAAFGGRGKCITTLSDLRGLLMRQPRGEKGVLLTNANGSANIFYIFNGTAFLRAVVVAWHVRGWCVDVCVLDGGGRWGEAGRVLAPSVASS